MPNLIQIKRSDSTATPTSLANGELAFSAASNVLFVGIKNTVVAVAGGRSPGTLVANQAIVVNASSLIDTIKVGNTVANVTTNTSGVYLANSTSNTRLTIPTSAQYTGGDYWLNANGSWLQIPAAVTSLDGLSDVTITTVANNDFLVYSNATSQWVNKATGNGFTFSSQTPSVLAANGIVVTAAGVNVLAGNNQLISNSSGLWVDQSKINHDALTNYDANKHVDHTAVSITAGNGLTGGGTIAASRTIDVGAGNGITVGADSVSVTAANGIVVTAAGVNVLAGNSQVVSNSTGVWVSGITSSQITGDIALGTQTSGNYVASITAGNGLTGDATGEGSTPTLAVGAGNGITVAADAVSVTAANGIVVTTAGVNVLAGNSQIVSNTTGVWVSGVTSAQIAGDIALGTQTSGNYVASITAGAGLTGTATGEGSTPTLAVGAGNGITVNADDIAVTGANGIIVTAAGVNVLAGTGVTVNATGVHIGQAIGTGSSVTFQDLTVNGNTALGSDTADRISINGYVNTAIVPDANNTRDLGTTALRWNNGYIRNLVGNTLTIDADATISGNLVVVGDLVTLNVATLSVEDPLIELARLNTATDALDIGFFGVYGSGGARYTGLFRDASDSKYKIFNALQSAPTTTVDTGGTGYAIGTLVSYLESSGLVTNATHVVLTSNSTVNVSITANTITLSNPLAGTSGGTGLSAYTAEDILVANTSNGFRKLAAGTDGQVLQISGTSVVYSSLDGGTF